MGRLRRPGVGGTGVLGVLLFLFVLRVALPCTMATQATDPLGHPRPYTPHESATHADRPRRDAHDLLSHRRLVAQSTSPKPNGVLQRRTDTSEKDALMALFEALNGAYWFRKEYWNTMEDVCQWEGVTCDTQGQNIVVSIDLSNNNVTGKFPTDALSMFGGLESINADYNMVYGTLPSDVGNRLPQTLKELSFGANSITGVLPDSLGQLMNLERISMWKNELQGTLPPSLGLLSNIAVLELGENQLSGPLPEELCEAPKLTTLWLLNNQLEGDLLACLGNATQLNTLVLSGNNFQGSIPDTFTTLPLQFFHASSCNFSGPLPESLASLTALVELHLDGNAFTGVIPKSYGQLTKLEHLYLDNNHLEGCIPTDLLALSGLQILSVSGNELDCVLPTEGWTSLLSLRLLDLSFNHLHGPLPKSLGEIPNLAHLWMSHNEFTGNVPDLGAFVSDYLLSIDLSHNYFETWPLSPMIYGTSVRGIDLSYNHIEGSISPLVNQFDHLQRLILRSNLFRGPIPEGVCDLQQLKELALSNTTLRSATPCDHHNASLCLPRCLELDQTFGMDGYTPSYGCPGIVGKRATLQLEVDDSYLSWAHCECLSGYYGSKAACAACLSNGFCPGYVLQTTLVAHAGFYPSPSQQNPEGFVKCNDILRGRTACNPEQGVKDDDLCAVGYEDRLCSKCSRDYFRWGFRCLSCPPGAVVVFLLCLLMICGIYVYLFFVRPTSAALLILIVYVQLIHLLTITRAPFPSPFLDFVNALSWVNFNIYTTECVIKWEDGVTGFYAMMLLPLAGFLVTFVVFVTGLLVKARVILANARQRRTAPDNDRMLHDPLSDPVHILTSFWSAKDPEHWGRVWFILNVRVMLYFLCLVYIPVSSAALRVFNCKRDSFDDHSYMEFIPYVACHVSDPAYRPMLAIAVPASLFYALGIPGLFAFLFRCHHNGLDTWIPQNMFGFLFMPYKVPHWEAILTLRKIIFILITSLATPSSTWFLFSLLCVLLLSIVLHLSYSPLVDRWENSFETSSQLGLLMTLVLMTLFQNSELRDETSASFLLVLVTALVLMFGVGLHSRRLIRRFQTPGKFFLSASEDALYTPVRGDS